VGSIEALLWDQIPPAVKLTPSGSLLASVGGLVIYPLQDLALPDRICWNYYFSVMIWYEFVRSWSGKLKHADLGNGSGHLDVYSYCALLKI